MPCFFTIFDENHIKRQVDGKINCINTIIIETKTYSNYYIPWWVPCAKISIPCFFAIILIENHMKDIKIKKEIALLLKPMTKTSQLNGKSRQDVFRRVRSPK